MFDFFVEFGTLVAHGGNPFEPREPRQTLVGYLLGKTAAREICSIAFVKSRIPGTIDGVIV
jgi:hypothetical protein